MCEVFRCISELQLYFQLCSFQELHSNVIYVNAFALNCAVLKLDFDSNAVLFKRTSKFIVIIITKQTIIREGSSYVCAILVVDAYWLCAKYSCILTILSLTLVVSQSSSVYIVLTIAF